MDVWRAVSRVSDGVLIALASICVAGITVGAPLIIAAFNTRKIVVQAKDHAEAAAESAAETKTTLGKINGNGDLMTMVARSLAELAEIHAKQEAIEAKVEDRTHIVRRGTTTPVELGPYMQDWFHEINSNLTIIRGTLSVLWHKLKEDYDLPDLALDVPPSPPIVGDSDG